MVDLSVVILFNYLHYELSYSRTKKNRSLTHAVPLLMHYPSLFGGYLSVLERCVYDGEGSLCPSVQFWCPALSPVARWSPLLNLVRTDEGFKSSSERPVPHTPG